MSATSSSSGSPLPKSFGISERKIGRVIGPAAGDGVADVWPDEERVVADMVLQPLSHVGGGRLGVEMDELYVVQVHDSLHEAIDEVDGRGGATVEVDAVAGLHPLHGRVQWFEIHLGLPRRPGAQIHSSEEQPRIQLPRGHE